MGRLLNLKDSSERPFLTFNPRPSLSDEIMSSNDSKVCRDLCTMKLLGILRDDHEALALLLSQ